MLSVAPYREPRPCLRRNRLNLPEDLVQRDVPEHEVAARGQVRLPPKGERVVEVVGLCLDSEHEKDRAEGNYAAQDAARGAPEAVLEDVQHVERDDLIDEG